MIIFILNVDYGKERELIILLVSLIPFNGALNRNYVKTDIIIVKTGYF